MNLQLSSAATAGDGAPAPAPAPRPAPAPAPAAGTVGTSQAASPETVREAARRVGESLKASGANLEFQVDDASGKVLVRIVDGQTGQLIRQIPSEEMLAIARALDRMQGLLLTQRA